MHVPILAIITTSAKIVVITVRIRVLFSILNDNFTWVNDEVKPSNRQRLFVTKLGPPVKLA